MSDQNIDFPQLMSYSTIGKKLGKSPHTIKRWSRERTLDFPAPRYINTTAVFYEHEINSWLNMVISTDPEAAKKHAEPGLLSRGLANSK